MTAQPTAGTTATSSPQTKPEKERMAVNCDEQLKLEDADLELRIKIAFQDREIPHIVRDPLFELLAKRFERVSQEDQLWIDRGNGGSVIGRNQLKDGLVPAMREAAKELATTCDFPQYEALRATGILKLVRTICIDQ